MPKVTALTPLPRPLKVGDTLEDERGVVFTATHIVSHNWRGTGYTLAEFTFVDEEGFARIDGGYAERYTLIEPLPPSVEAQISATLAMMLDRMQGGGKCEGIPVEI